MMIMPGGSSRHTSLAFLPDSYAISCIPGKELLSKDVKSARSSELESKTKIFVMLVPYYMNENYPG